jgi:hypothetical protein
MRTIMVIDRVLTLLGATDFICILKHIVGGPVGW